MAESSVFIKTAKPLVDRGFASNQLVTIIYCRHSDGTKRSGLPSHDHTITPPEAVLILGVSTIVTAAPTDAVPVDPNIVMIPPSVTLPPVTLPTAVTVKPTPDDTSVASAAARSATEVLKELADNINSDTFERIV